MKFKAEETKASFLGAATAAPLRSRSRQDVECILAIPKWDHQETRKRAIRQPARVPYLIEIRPGETDPRDGERRFALAVEKREPQFYFTMLIPVQ